MLHFFTPNEIDEVLLWAHEALKPNGHIYILTISPYIKSYQEKILPLYMLNREKNVLFPGYISDAEPYLNETTKNDPNYCVPKNLLFFALEDLCRLFESHGFVVEKTYSVSLPSNENLKWTVVPSNQSSLVGLKVRKATG